MKRRDFLKAAGAAAVGMGLPQVARTEPASLKPDRLKVMPKAPKYMLWTGPDGRAPIEKVKAKYVDLKRRGITGVFLGGYDEREVAAIKEAELEAHIWTWTTNRGDQWVRDNHPDWYQVSRSGKSCFDKPPYVDYYRWLSPVIPGVVQYIKEKFAEVAVKEGVDGMHFDYVRYPDVILPKALWKDYNLVQHEELPDYDFCYSEHTRKAFKDKTGRDPLEIKDPAHDQEWLHFRYDSVTNLVNEVAAEIRRYGKQVTAAVFPTPRLARKICRQNWGGWPLDYATPMIYHSFYEEPVEWVGDCVLENIQNARFPIVAGLYMPAFKTPDEFKTGLELVRKRGGAGVSLFGGIGDDYWKVFEAHVSA